MKRNKQIDKIEVQIPAINADKEGRLLGGFSAFGINARGSDNGTCPNNPTGCISNGTCSCNDNCSNNTSCAHNHKSPCSGNGSCVNTICHPQTTTPGGGEGETPTESSNRLFSIGFSALF